MLIFTYGLVVSAILVLLLRRYAEPLGLMDRPGGRKLHAVATPTVGGLAMFLAVALAIFVADGYSDSVQVLMNCAAMLVVLGVWDDRRGLSVKLRMMVQVFLSQLVILGADGLIDHLGAILFAGDLYLGVFAVPLSVVAFVGGINAMNMIDGADGMAGKMAFITTAGAALIFADAGRQDALLLALALAGALLGFLYFNSRLLRDRALVFMGDAGSMWIGLVLGWFMVQVAHMAEPALVLWLFGIPLLDALVVISRRLMRKQSPFEADRTHIHHVLEDMGIPIKRSVVLLSLVQVVLVGVGVAGYHWQAPAALVFWGFLLVFVVYAYVFRHAGMA